MQRLRRVKKSATKKRGPLKIIRKTTTKRRRLDSEGNVEHVCEEEQETWTVPKALRGAVVTPEKRVAEKRSVPPSPFHLNLHPIFTTAEVFEEKYFKIMEDK